MKTAEEIRNQVAFKYGFSSWDQVLQEYQFGKVYLFKPKSFNELELEAMQEYASQFKPKWVDRLESLPSDNQKILFQLSNKEIRLGTFLSVDQWNRPNMFCDGAFHHAPHVLKWQPLTPPED